MLVATATFLETGQGYTGNVTATVFNVGPLTTTFTPPTPCAASDIGNWFLIDNTNSSDPSYYYDCNNMVSTTVNGKASVRNDYVANTNCIPSGNLVSSIWMLDTYGLAMYSPGLYCPSGWATSGLITHSPTASSIAVSGITTAAVSLMTVIGSTGGTHVICCPSQWSLSDLGCLSTITTPTSGTLCDGTCNQAVTTVNAITTPVCPLTPTPFAWNTLRTDSTPLYYVDAVWLLHQQSDVPSSQSSTSPASASSWALGQPSGQGHGSGIVRPSIVAAVVVPVAAMLLLLSTLWVVLERRRQKLALNGTPPSSPSVAWLSSIMPSRSQTQSSRDVSGPAASKEQGEKGVTMTVGRHTELPAAHGMSTQFALDLAGMETPDLSSRAVDHGPQIRVDNPVNAADQPVVSQPVFTGNAKHEQSTRLPHEVTSALQAGMVQDSRSPRSQPVYELRAQKRSPGAGEGATTASATQQSDARAEGVSAGSSLPCLLDESIRLRERIIDLHLEELQEQRRQVLERIDAVPLP